MTTLVKKSIYIIIYYIAVAAFSCLAFSALLNSYKATGILQDGLGDESLQVSIVSPSGESSMTTGQFVDELLAMNPSPFLLYKDNGSNYGVEYSIHNRELPFSVKTISRDEESPVMILDEALLHNTATQNGDKIFLYKSKPYHVIATFDKQEKNINQDSSFYASLDKQADVTGTYYIDGLEAEEITKTLDTLVSGNTELNYQMLPLKKTVKERVALVIQDQALVVILLAATLFLIAINTIGTTLAWIHSRNDEIYARYLVGATFKNLQWWLLKDYWLIVAGSFAAGLAVSFIIVQSGVFNYVVNDLNIIGIAIALVFCLILGTMTEIISTLWDYRKKETIRKGI